MTVNERAPVVATSELEFAGNPQLVWDVLTEIDRWPTWNPDVKAPSPTLPALT